MELRNRANDLDVDLFHNPAFLQAILQMNDVLAHDVVADDDGVQVFRIFEHGRGNAIHGRVAESKKEVSYGSVPWTEALQTTRPATSRC